LTNQKKQFLNNNEKDNINYCGTWILTFSEVVQPNISCKNDNSNNEISINNTINNNNNNVSNNNLCSSTKGIEVTLICKPTNDGLFYYSESCSFFSVQCNRMLSMTSLNNVIDGNQNKFFNCHWNSLWWPINSNKISGYYYTFKGKQGRCTGVRV
jgi:hypothetical protein